MSQVRISRGQGGTRASGFEHILARQGRRSADRPVQGARPAMAAAGLALILVGGLLALMGSSQITGFISGETAVRAALGVLLLFAGLAFILLSEPLSDRDEKK